jgi:hypothetical protein
MKNLRQPPKSYFAREVDLFSDDGITRTVTGGRIGRYGRQYVDLKTHRFISENRYERFVRAALERADRDSALTFAAQCPEMVAAFEWAST